jgi:hypothetical protein
MCATPIVKTLPSSWMIGIGAAGTIGSTAGAIICGIKRNAINKILTNTDEAKKLTLDEHIALERKYAYLTSAMYGCIAAGALSVAITGKGVYDYKTKETNIIEDFLKNGKMEFTLVNEDTNNQTKDEIKIKTNDNGDLEITKIDKTNSESKPTIQTIKKEELEQKANEQITKVKNSKKTVVHRKEFCNRLKNVTLPLTLFRDQLKLKITSNETLTDREKMLFIWQYLYKSFIK